MPGPDTILTRNLDIPYRGFAHIAKPQLPTPPLDAYHMCNFVQGSRSMDIVYTSLSLLYGTLKLS